MCNLRQQLRQAARRCSQQARAEYRDAAYPGDLAAEILPSRGAWMRWVLRTAVGGSLAAVLAVMVSNRGADPQSGAPFNVRHAANTHLGASPTPMVYNLPARMPLAFPASPFLAAAPPVLVSLRADALELLQQPYEQWLAGRLIDPFSRRHVTPAPRSIEKAPDSSGPSTQSVVG